MGLEKADRSELDALGKYVNETMNGIRHMQGGKLDAQQQRRYDFALGEFRELTEHINRDHSN